ncbi:MAG: type II toxin-antitoxin system VapC family toxin [Deltaproteobacteria bacterium]|nr:type II toxin-antitoxin system VapC family toxin [Deltaproteobacteria bacterium]MBW1927838.1 type II toxin-antitoxin system VapC family toxin [Deltaproteobacteria bacterium]MBW2026512.1 type II toxin-antitoxin system VapC family toxin [Deltaproteobacteria bacterium]
MKLLLDTSPFLWIILDAPELSGQAIELFTDPDNEVYLSTVSTWEIAIKYELGKLPLPEAPEKFIPFQRAMHGIEPLPLDEESTLYLTKLPYYHKDPFDRMLVCQAIVNGLVILTPDQLIRQYPVRTSW